MAENTSAIAALLREFIETTDKQAIGLGLEPASDSPSQPVQSLYEQRLTRLSPEDRAAFHRMLKAMHGAS